MTTTHPHETRVHETAAESSRLPRLSRYTIERPALFDRLDRALREQATIVRAPAGYGKTSLVRKWLDRTDDANRPSATWVDLDLVGGGIEGFWDAMRAAVDPRDESAFWDADPLAATQDGIGRHIGTVVLVLDGYTRRWDGLLSGELVQLLRRTPNLHLMVLTRALTSFEAPALAAVLDLVVVQNDDLAFERRELDEVVQLLGTDVEPRVLDHVWKRSHGWPLAARAMIRVFDDPRAVLPEPVVARALEEISETVVSELLAQAPIGAAERNGLQRAAVAPYLAPHIVARIGADGADDGALAVAESAGLGVWTYARGQGRLVYEFLDPVRAVLRSQLEVESPGEGDRLAGELLDVLEANGDPITALRQALRSNEIVAAETILARNWTSAFTEEADDYLQELGALELGGLRSSVILLTVTGLLRENAGGDPLGALDYYHAAAEPQALRGRRLEPVRQYWTDLTSMIALRKVGRLSQADDFLAALSAPDPTVAEPPLAWLEIGLTQLRLGRDQEAATAFERAAIGAADDPNLYTYSTGAASLAYALHGEIDRAQAVATRVEAFVVGDHTLRPTAFIPVAVASRLIDTEAHPDGAVESRSPWVNLEADLGELHSYSAYAAALGALASGELEQAQQIIDAELLSKSAHSPSNSERARFVALEADLLMSQGNLVAAQKLIKSFPDGTNALRPVSARLLLMFREYRSAQLLAEAVLGEGAGPRTRVEMLLVQAEALQRLKSARAATIRLNARQVAEANNLLTPFVLTIAGHPAPSLAVSVDGAGEGVAETALAKVKPLFSEAAMAAQLTQRERIVLDRLQSTASLEYIARSLVVSINTVKTQTRSIYRKLGANSRDEAVRIAYDLGLLRPRLPLGRNRYEGDDRIA
jgi:LuxR family transcriptional regulator, maltose regulon positive regulatory protein